MALTRKVETSSYDDKKASKQKKQPEASVSYQEEGATQSKMKPTSSTVEGSP